MEDFNKFINHKDPTKPSIDPESITLESQFTKLTEEEKIVLAARLLGCRSHVPTDIKTFIFDEYFMGTDQLTNKGTAIFPYWVDKLEEIFPNPIITRYPYILLTGEFGAVLRSNS